MFAKDPKRRKSRSGSRTRANDSGSNSRSRKSSSSSRTFRAARGGQFLLYVEGARDREILTCWARRVDPGLAKCIESSTIILGGRRPARALSDFEKRGGVSAGHAGIVVLDRDDHAHEAGTSPNFSAEGLEVFVWTLRHIESYLLVPAAIRRMLRLGTDDRSVERFIDSHVWPDSASHDARNGSRLVIGDAPIESTSDVVERPAASPHAKRILGAGGSLSEALGAELRAGDIARAMRLEDLHLDVRDLLDRIGILSGWSVKGPEVVVRASTSVRVPTDS